MDFLLLFEVIIQWIILTKGFFLDRKYQSIPPVYKGEATPLVKTLKTAEYVHGEDGLGGSSLLQLEDGSYVYPKPSSLHVEKSGVDAILDILASNERGSITIVTLGPLTNIAKAAQKYG